MRYCFGSGTLPIFKKHMEMHFLLSWIFLVRCSSDFGTLTSLKKQMKVHFLLSWVFSVENCQVLRFCVDLGVLNFVTK